jgi:flagellar basal-body rod protein FlgB
MRVREEFRKMYPDIFSSTTVPVLQEVLNFAQARHGVLAGNIANIDTPGYRVRDLSVETFQQRLKEAIHARHTQGQQSSEGMVADDRGDGMQQVRESLKHVLFHDGSDVAMEQQVTELTKNQMMHNMAIAIISNQFRLLQAAVSERV